MLYDALRFEISNRPYVSRLDCFKKSFQLWMSAVTLRILRLKLFSDISLQQMVREEVKEMVKWCLDRTSPSNKLRDFMEWSRVILKDSIYQRRILRSSLMRLFTGYWLTWNYSILILSLVICIMLLIGRVAPQGHAITIDNPVNQTVPLVFYTQ